MKETLQRRKYLTRLRCILAERFDEEDLRTLCSDLGIDYDDLPAKGRANKARELINHLDRHKRIPELIEIGKKLRPDVTWEGMPDAATQEEVTPIYEEWPGWLTDTTGARKWEDLPPNAQRYLRRIEELCGAPQRYVSVGPRREQIIVME